MMVLNIHNVEHSRELRLFCAVQWWQYFLLTCNCRIKNKDIWNRKFNLNILTDYRLNYVQKQPLTIYNILQKHELKYQDWKLCQNSYEKRNFFIETSMLIKNFSQVLKTSQHELWVVKFNFLYVNCYTLTMIKSMFCIIVIRQKLTLPITCNIIHWYYWSFSLN